MVNKMITAFMVITIGLLQTTLAAKGRILLNGREHVNPTGCIAIERDAITPTKFQVDNQSDKVLTAHSTEQCDGVVHKIYAGGEYVGTGIRAISVE
ncbi:unnamed protein product [Cunninghamella blakesleeana]